jgi:hypothetical protein
MPDLGKHHRNAQNIVRPCALAVTGQVIQIELKLFGKLFRSNYQFAIRARRNGHTGGETDGTGHYEAVVVIGVFAQQIDSARGAEDSRRRPKCLLKMLS